MDYQDFVLQLDRAAGGSGFVARVVVSPAGEAEAPFVDPVAPTELDGLWRTASAARRAYRARQVRDLARQDPGLEVDALAAELSLEDLGDRLFTALFCGPVRSCWAKSVAALAADPRRGLRLKLQLDLADRLVAPLAELPWEYLYSLEHGGFLGLDRRTPIIRHLRLPLAAGRLPPARPLRVLVVSSQPASMARLSLREEGEKVAAALAALPGVETLPLNDPSVETLREVLLARDYHVLHFMGHGDFDPASGQGVLWFAGPGGAPLPVSGPLLASHLTGLPSLRLVFVNACETARAAARAPFAGVATALLRAGLPAVVAMQRPIRDDSALELSRVVYRRLAEGDPIDAAVTEGRLAIARGRGALLEWGTPVLFSRAEDGLLFAAASTVAPPVKLTAPAAELKAPAAELSVPAPRRVAHILPRHYPLLLVAVLAGAIGVKYGLDALEGDGRSVQEPSFVTNFEPPPLITSGMEDEPPDEEPQPPPKPQQKPQPDDPPSPRAPSASSYRVTQDAPAFIADLGVEVGATFFERSGRSLARFWIAPAGESRLEQPPILSPGPISFPSGGGTYHLEVLSFDAVGRSATVRARFAPNA